MNIKNVRSRFSLSIALCATAIALMTVGGVAYALDIDADTTLTSDVFEQINIGGVNTDPFTVKTSPGIALGNNSFPITTYLHNRANFELDGGGVFNLVLRDNATSLLNEGGVKYLDAGDNSHTVVSGVANAVGVDYLTTTNFSTTDITSGEIGHITAYGSSTVNISGGLVGLPKQGIGGATYSLIGAFDQSTINFVGSGFSLGVAAPGSYSSYTGDFYHVTGTLADGTGLDAQLFIASDGPATIDPHVNFGGVVVPEMGTLQLLLLGSIIPVLGWKAIKSSRSDAKSAVFVE